MNHTQTIKTAADADIHIEKLKIQREIEAIVGPLIQKHPEEFAEYLARRGIVETVFVDADAVPILNPKVKAEVRQHG